MADFTIANQGTPSASQAQVSGSPSGGLAGAAVIADAASDFVSLFARSAASASSSGPTFAQAKDQAANLVVGNYMSAVTALADAVHTGKMPSAQAQTMVRSTLQQYIANNPEHSEALIGAQKDFVSTTGLGKVVAEGTDQEKEFQRQ